MLPPKKVIEHGIVGREAGLGWKAFERLGGSLERPVNERLLKQVLKDMEAGYGSAKPSASVGRHLRIEGPMVKVFKGAKIWDVPRRLLQAVNPFAPSESTEAVSRSRDLNPNAWASSVGWQHEGMLGRKEHPEYKARRSRWVRRLLGNGVENLIKEARQESDGKPQAQSVEDELGYFVHNVERMQ